jgi:hypothetical protein
VPHVVYTGPQALLTLHVTHPALELPQGQPVAVGEGLLPTLLAVPHVSEAEPAPAPKKPKKEA